MDYRLSLQKAFSNFFGMDRNKLLQLLLFILCSISISAQAGYFDDLKTAQQPSNQQIEWQHFGPGMSGYIDKFWIHGADNNAMFMDLDMGNAHGTWDRGDSWGSIRDSDGTGAEMTAITGMAFSHQDPDFGILLAKEGIFKTNDHGRSWQFLVDADLSNSEKHSVITVDPNDDNVWYIGAGQHWMIKFTHFNKNGLIYTTDRNHSEGFILKSTNKGQSWTKITSVFPADTDFSNIIVHPADSNKVFASTQHGVYRSFDAGITWEKVPGSGLPHNQPRDMDFHYNATSGLFTLYIVEVTHYTPNGTTIDTSGGVYRSTNDGASWANITGNLAIDMNQINVWSYEDRYYRAIAFWLDISKATVKSLYPDLPAITFSQFTGIEVDPRNRDRIYLVHNFKHDYAFPPGNIWMTSDGGTNWVAAAREGQYWINEVDKAYWQSRNNPLGMNTTFAHVHREHAEHDDIQTGPRFLEIDKNGWVYTAFAQQVMRSTDNGLTWNQIDDFETSPGSGHWVGRGDSNLPGESISTDTGTPGIYLFGSGEHGLWRNTTDGDLVYPGAIAVEQLTGQSIDDDDPTSIGAIAVHPMDKDKLYTLQFRQARRGELRHSADNGATWQTLSTPINFPGAQDVIKQFSLLIDHSQPQYMYFCVPRSEFSPHSNTQWAANKPKSDPNYSAYGIYKSSDGGLSWSFANNGIPANKSVHRLAMDPSNSQVLYAALNARETGETGGLYKSTNRGGSWSPVNLPAGVTSVNHVVVSKVNSDLYIATGTYANDGSTGGAFVSSNGGSSWQLIFDMPNVRDAMPSPVLADVVAVNVGHAREIGSINPGAYITIDAGTTWHKTNKNHGQPGRIRMIEMDPYDANVFWVTLFGTGFWKVDFSVLGGPGGSSSSSSSGGVYLVNRKYNKHLKSVDAGPNFDLTMDTDNTVR